MIIKKKRKLIIEEKRNLIFIIFNIFLLILLMFFVTYTKNTYDFQRNWYKVISILSLLFLVYYFAYFYKYRLIYDFRFWFIVLTYLFMFGKTYLRFFNIEDPFYRPFLDGYSDELLYSASLIVVCYVQALFTGFIWISKKTKRSKVYNILTDIPDRVSKKIIFNTGLILFVCALPFRIITDYNVISTTYFTGSYSNYSGQSGIAYDIAFLFIPGLIFMISSSYKKRRFIIALISIVIAYIVLMMVLSGDRRFYISGLLAIALSFLKAYNIKLSSIKLISFAILSNFLFNLLAIIRNIRSKGLLSPIEFFQTYGNDLISFNGFTEAMSEFGFSFYSVVQVVNAIPDKIPHQLGLGFFGAIPTLLPIGFLIGDFLKKVSISRTVNVLEGHSLGSTIIGNLYSDFSWFLVIFTIIMGKVLLEITTTKTIDNKNLAYARQYSLLYILINLVRGSFLESFRPTMMIFWIPLLILMIQKNRISRDRQVNEEA